MKKYKAFSLAEVLVVITILGVVASMTIPGLVTSISLQQRKAQLKKIYGALSEATTKIVEGNNGTMVGLVEIGWTDYSLISQYLPYLNISKTCSHPNTRGNCWHEDGAATYDNGIPASDATWEYVGRSVVLADGSFFAISDMWPNCDNMMYAGSSLTDICAFAKVDLNGFKGPNIYGKDIFEFYVTKKRLVPCGSQGDYHDPCADGTYNCHAFDMLVN